jgi:hypothetical protein
VLIQRAARTVTGFLNLELQISVLNEIR